MEILNNIWMAISTPDEGLINIILTIGSIIENLFTMLLFLSILKIKSNNKQKLLYVILMSVVSFVTRFIIPEPFNIFFNYFMMLFFISFIFKLSILNAIIASVSSAITFGIVGFLVANTYMTILHISSEQLSSIPIYRLGYLFSMYIIVMLIILILKNRDLKLSLIDNVDTKNKILIFMNLFLGILTLIIQSTLMFYFIDSFPLIITLLSFVSLLAYLSISIYSLTRALKLSLTTKKLQSAEAYNNTLRILHDNVRGFKHDFDNIVTTIGGYIKTNDMEGLKNYYSQLEDDCQRVNNLYILNPDIVNNDV